MSSVYCFLIIVVDGNCAVVKIVILTKDGDHRFGKTLRFPRARDEPPREPTESGVYSGCEFHN